MSTGLDLLLALGMLWLAWQILHGPNLFRAVVSFMVFGLLMAIAWVRLEAPDIALAEAAIGAGVTGALLLSTLGRLPERQTMTDANGAAAPRQRRRGSPWLAAGGAVVLLLGLATLQLPAPGLGEVVGERLPLAGLGNPVNAVLLNFRAFDTLLELAVLLLAVMVSWSFGAAVAPPTPPQLSPILPALVRLLAPVFVLTGVYLLWRGSHAPGGAFPAGAVLGAGGVLMLLAGHSPWQRPRWRQPLHWLLVSGVAAFLAVALLLTLAGQGFLQYPPAWAQALALLIEICAAAAIGTMLMALYLGGEPPLDRRKERP